jgi:hypothetical protein
MKLDELRAVNAFFGFCVPSAGTWPSPLFDLGYAVFGVEREITTRLDGQPRTRVLDFACGSATQNHVLGVEAKSRTVEEGQARTYAAVRPSDFVDQLWLTDGFAADTLSRDITYLTGSEDCGHVIRSLAELGIDLPVVGCDGTRFDLEAGTLTCPRTDTLLREGIPLGADHEWPDHHVRFKSDSGDAKMVAFVLASVAGFVIRGNSFTIDEVCGRAVGHWEWCGQTEQRAFRQSITRLIDRAASEELGPFVRRTGTERKWEARKGRLVVPQQIGSFQRSADRFVQRVQLGVPFNDQLSLFDPSDQDD